MAAVKCSKCGGIIPDGALFCPACGAPVPKAVEQPAPAPVQTAPPQQPTTQSAYAPKKSRTAGAQNLIDSLTSKTVIMLGLFIGVLIAWIAKVIGQFLDYGTTELKIMNTINFTLMAGVGLLLLCGGFFNKILNKYVRVGLIVAGALLLAYHL